jgi:hypothetical protein
VNNRRGRIVFFSSAITALLVAFSKLAAAEGATVDTKGEFSFYVDDDAVTVITPGVDLSVVHPLDGWSVNAGYLLDVVSAASVDIVATASSAWVENRNVGVLGGSYKPNEWQGQISGAVSHEPDYLSLSGGVSLSVELDEKHITPLVGYSYSHDIGGRTGTPYDVYGLVLDRHSAQLSSAFVINKSTLLTLIGDAIFEFGSQEKPYRTVPLFSSVVASQLQPGQSVDSVNALRVGQAEESTPKTRQRYAATARIAWRGDATTWILTERAYGDSWGVVASTTEINNIHDLSEDFYLGVHGRLHLQGGADFYEIGYTGGSTSGVVTLPAYRTGDRELGSETMFTGGLGAHWDFAETWGGDLQVDGGYTEYPNALFITNRLSFLTALLINKEF